MKWRCPQCGKPHERNDPPCDNCGHHKFERAVVPQATADDSYEQFIWVCTECGRQHQRNNPPCSRCGNGTFEKQPLDYGDVDPGDTPGYLDLVGRQELAAAVVALGLVVVGILGFTGVIDIPGITPQEPPSVSDVPGDADAVGSLSLSAVENATLDGLDAERSTPLGRDEGLGEMATFVNQRLVKNRYTDENVSITERQLQRFSTDCSGRITFARALTPGAVSGDASADQLGTELAAQLRTRESDLTGTSVTLAGVDVHAGPDDRLFVTVAYC